MIVQFFRYGNGLSKGPLDYLLGKDRDRDYAKVLQGDVSEVSGLIDTSPFAKKYTSGCLSFYEHDLSDQDKQQIMQNFEQALFPGMDQRQYRVLWIEHQDKKNEETGKRRLELNFLIPNIEILTGKRLQPYFDRADRSRVDLFKKITNYEYQLHDADDPLYQQDIKHAKNLPKAVNEIKETLNILATKAVENGLITDRQSMKTWLLDLGLEISRETKKSLSIKNPNNDDPNARPIKLKGAIYEQDFRLTEESERLTIAASERYRREAEQRNQSNIQRYAEYSAKRSTELEQQYRQHQSGYTAETERSNERDIAADQQDDSPNQTTAAAGHERSIAITTTADQAAPSELAAIERLEPRHRTSSKYQENPYQIEYSLDFTSMYNAYQQYLFSIRQQKQVQRDASEISTFAADRSNDTAENSRVQHNHVSLVQSQRGAIDDTRGAVIEDYRAATAAAQRAARAAAESLSAYRAAGADYQRARELHSDFKRETQRSSASRETLSNDSEAAIRADNTTAFFRQFAERLTATAGETFNSVSRLLEHRAADHQSLTTPDADRNREAARTTDQTSDRENEFSRAISAKTSRFSATPIREALERVEQRQQIEVEKKQDYDSPRPF